MEVVCSFNVEIPNFEEPYRVVLVSAFMVVAVPIVVLNFLVILAIWKTSSLHKPSKILLANLALTDFFSGSILCPLIAFENVAIMKRWDTAYCNFWPIATPLIYGLVGINLFILAVMSVDRFLAIKMKLTYRNIVTNKRVIAAMVFGWTSFFFLFIIFSILLSRGIPIGNFMIPFMAITAMVLCTLATFTFLSLYYLRKYMAQTHSLNEQLPNTSAPFDIRSYRRTFHTMLMVLFAIFSSFLPYFSVAITREILKTTPLILLLIAFTSWFIPLNSAINPVLYLWRMKDLRQAVKTVCRKRQ